MKKILSSILIFVFSLSVFITPAFADDPQFSTRDTYNYNFFNMTLNPFMVNDDGIGLYYAGYIPEIGYTTMENASSSNIDDLYNSSENVEIMDYLQLHQSKFTCEIKFNAMKTMFYYFDGESYKMFANAISNGFSDCVRTSLQNFLNYCGFGVSSASTNVMLYNYCKENNFKFDNYCITCDPQSNIGRSYEVSHRNDLTYGIYYKDALQYGVKTYIPRAMCYIIKYVNSINNYSYSDFYISNYDVVFWDQDKDNDFDDTDYYVLNWDHKSNSSNYSMDLIQEIFCFDFHNTLNRKIERIYLTRSDLEKYGAGSGITISDGRLLLNVSSLKSISNFCIDGDISNIELYGIGMQYGVPYNLNADSFTYYDFQNVNNYLYSNCIYYAFNYDLSNTLPASIKTYKLMNDYSSFTIIYEGYPLDSNGSYITDGDDSTNNTDQDNNGDGVVDWTDEFGGIGNILGSLRIGINSLVEFVGDVPAMFGSVLSFLPPEISALLTVSISILCIIAIIKFLRG